MISDTTKIGLICFIVLHAFLLLGLALIRLRKYQTRIPDISSSTMDIDLKWLNYIIIAMFTIHLSITIYNIIYYQKSLNLLASIWTLIIVYFAGYNALKQKEIYPKNQQHRDELLSITKENISENRKKLLGDEELIYHKTRLISLMKEKTPYLDNNINLSRLAEIAKITPHQLSYIINNGFNENFFQFINKYRIEKAKECLLSEKNDNLSMLGIAYESGFNSKTSFNTTFKKIVGLTPSEFKKKQS